MINDLVSYLTHGFAEWFGERPGATFDVQPGGELTVNIVRLTPEGQQLARHALEAWSGVTGIRFSFVSHDDVHIMFDDNEEGAAAYSTFDGDTIISALIVISTEWLDTYGTSINSYSFTTYLHEIGHALGLGHPGPYNDEDADFLINTVSFYDSWQTTVMSYFDQTENIFTIADYAVPVTPMIADIMAIHALYGEPDNVNGGNTRYGYKSNTGTYMDEFFREWSAQSDTYFLGDEGALTIYDTGGIDWLDLRTDEYDQLIDLNPESASDVTGLIGNLIIAHDTIIENVFAGYGDDWIFGNTADNRLYGGYSGDDVLIGGDGNDILWGYSGMDLLKGDAGNDRLIGGLGDDTLVGGQGNDRFYFRPEDGIFEDEIIDFGYGDDVIDLRAFDTIHSVLDLGYYWYDETQTDSLIDLTDHGGGWIILVGYTDSIHDSDFIFSDGELIA